ncbi:hypothetical protein C8R44DRAFT_989631, partial [Mycena epipterygia]
MASPPSISPARRQCIGLMFPPQQTSPPQTLASTSTSQIPHQHAPPRTSSSASFAWQSDVLDFALAHDIIPSADEMQTQHWTQQLRRASFSQAQLQARPVTPELEPTATVLAPADPRVGVPIGIDIDAVAAAADAPPRQRFPTRLDTDLDIVSLARGRGWKLRRSPRCVWRVCVAFVRPFRLRLVCWQCIHPHVLGLLFFLLLLRSRPRRSPHTGALFLLPRVHLGICILAIKQRIVLLLEPILVFFHLLQQIRDARLRLLHSRVYDGRPKQVSAGEMTRDSPVLVAFAATAVANTSAPQGARLHVGCAPWVVGVRILGKIELGMLMHSAHDHGRGGESIHAYRDEPARGGGDRAGDGSEEGSGEGGARLLLDGTVYMQQRPVSPYRYQQHEEGAHHLPAHQLEHLQSHQHRLTSPYPHRPPSPADPRDRARTGSGPSSSARVSSGSDGAPPVCPPLSTAAGRQYAPSPRPASPYRQSEDGAHHSLAYQHRLAPPYPHRPTSPSGQRDRARARSDPSSSSARVSSGFDGTPPVLLPLSMRAAGSSASGALMSSAGTGAEEWEWRGAGRGSLRGGR